MCQPIAGELPQFLFCGCSAGFQHDKRLGRFSPVLMRKADDGDFLHSRMPQQDSFDLYR